jgi:hypothetical protein
MEGKHVSKKTGFTPPASAPKGASTLWQCTLRLATAKEDFLFREKDDFALAAATAANLVDGSPACKMAGAVIIEIKRVAHLWN